MTARTIELAPSWEYALGLHALVCIEGTPEGQRNSHEYLADIGKMLDRLAEQNPAAFTEARKGLNI